MNQKKYINSKNKTKKNITTRNKTVVSLNQYLTISDIENHPHCRSLNNIIKNRLKHDTWDHFAGNCMYHHKKDFVVRGGKHADNLRNNLFQLGGHAKSVLEIGCNGGHSTMLFLLGNPKLHLLCFDLCIHGYTTPCLKYLNWGNRLTFVKGDSTQVIPKYHGKGSQRKYDIIHIDGSHKASDAYLDLLNCRRFAHQNTIIIFDDADFPNLKKMLEVGIKKHYWKDISRVNANGTYSQYPYLTKTAFHRLLHYGSHANQMPPVIPKN